MEWGCESPSAFRKLSREDKAEMMAFLEVKSAIERYYLAKSDDKIASARKEAGKTGKKKKYPKQ